MGGKVAGLLLGLFSTVKLAALGLLSSHRIEGRKQAASRRTTRADSAKVVEWCEVVDWLRHERLMTGGKSVLREGVGRGTVGTSNSDTVRRKACDSLSLPCNLE